MVEYAHLRVPRLMIIAERGYCASATSWQHTIEVLYGIVCSESNVVLQIRNKASVEDWVVIESFCRQVAQQNHNKVFINGHHWPDVLLARHLPEALITIQHHPCDSGGSIHSVKGLLNAEHHKLRYVQFGAVFPTSKPVVPMGTDALRDICDRSTLPVLAVGGIQSMEHVEQCIQSGAHGVSIGSWILNSEHPQKLIQGICQHIEQHDAHRSEFR